MADIIIRGDRAPGPPLPNHPGVPTYDPNNAQDHTGLRMLAAPRTERGGRGNPLIDPTQLMTRPTAFTCPECGGKEFRLTVDDSSDASSGLIQILCAKPRCRVWPVLQMGQPQVNDIVARRMGLIIPKPTLSFDLDDEDD